MNATVINQQSLDTHRLQNQKLETGETVSQSSGYTLATGAAEVERLDILNRIYGLKTECLLREVGLSEGMRVVDVGCGSGIITRWIAKQVKEKGSVIGFDASPEQIEQARILTAETGLKNIVYQVADVYAPGLPLNSFDLVFCRLVLMHLTHPVDALHQMKALLKPGGRLVCEEMDLSYMTCDPFSEAFKRLVDLDLALSDHRGQHHRLGSWLFRLFLEVGLSEMKIEFHLPCVKQVENKRLTEISFAQISTALIHDGLTTQAEFDRLFAVFKQLTADPMVLFMTPLMGQVWAINT
ncbi:MAG: class I SAM-dependent methyltransferase [Chroococcidiopsidaceae cyanobacterium CP_BM_ER_R8_30]|nr:class I SAM-dependent methyltransferase [Chroococcidiopsidaceae cyanobacterium CP_BM_ER_R8_30]